MHFFISQKSCRRGCQICGGTELRCSFVLLLERGGANVGFMDLFPPRYYMHVFVAEEMRSSGARHGDGENGPMRRVKDSASPRGRRPEETAPTCGPDFADVCWGQRRVTLVVITEAALCCIHFRCIFLSFFFSLRELWGVFFVFFFGGMCEPNVCRRSDSHASMLT